MQSPNDSALPEFRNISFNQLENFVNMASVMIQDYDTQFLNQAQEINKIFAQVGNNDRKCEEINRRVNYLRHTQQIIDLNIKITNKMFNEIEEFLVCLEGGEPNKKLNYSEMDHLRIMVYPITLQMNEAITCIITKLDDILSTVRVSNKGNVNSKDQAKKAHKILDNQLKQLEHLELTMHKMMNTMQTINNNMALKSSFANQCKCDLNCHC